MGWSVQIEKQNEHYAQFLSSIDHLDGFAHNAENSTEATIENSSSKNGGPLVSSQNSFIDFALLPSQNITSKEYAMSNNQFKVKADVYSPPKTNDVTIDLTRTTSIGDQSSRLIEKSCPLTASDSNSGIIMNAPRVMKLRPPANIQHKNKQISENSRVDMVFEIYVTQFDPEITCKKIAQHIVDFTSFENDDQFNVELLGGHSNKLKRKTFVSFKITTLKNSVCDLILDEKI